MPKDRRLGFTVIARLGLGAASLGCCHLAGGEPGSFSDPTAGLLHRSGHSEESLRHSGAEGLINGVRLQRHRNRRGLVCAGIIKFAIDHDGDGHQVRLAVGRQLHQCQRSRPFADRRLLGKLSRCGLRKGQSQSRQDDGARQVTI